MKNQFRQYNRKDCINYKKAYYLELAPGQGEKMTTYLIGEIATKMGVSVDSSAIMTRKGYCRLLNETRLAAEFLRMTI